MTITALNFMSTEDLVAAVQSGSLEQQHLIHALETLGERDSRLARDELLKYLTHESGVVREVTILALGNYLIDYTVLDALRNVKQTDPNEIVRSIAADVCMDVSQ